MFDIKGKIFLVFMVGFIDKVFRRFCLKFGVDVIVIEMVSSKVFVFGSVKIKEFILFLEEEKIRGI